MFNIYKTIGTWGFVVTEIQSNSQYFGTFPKWINLKNHDNLVSFNDTNGELTYIRLGGDRGQAHIFRSKGSEYYSLTSMHMVDGFFCYCGPFGMCVMVDGLNYSCKCLYGFHFASAEATLNHDFSAGCARNVPLSCNDISVGSNDTFTLIDNLSMIVDNYHELDHLSVEECQSACRNNCSCTAYTYDSRCRLRYGDLIYATIVDDNEYNEQLYIRIGSSSVVGTSVVCTKRNHIKCVSFIGGGNLLLMDW